jgi:hypothetical protein
MCTPENLPPLCSCPHLLWRDVRGLTRAVGVLALAAGVWLVVATVPAWELGIGAWLALMCVSAAVSMGRRRVQLPAACRPGDDPQAEGGTQRTSGRETGT